MEWLTSLLDLVMHLDTHLLALSQEYGVWIYAILFLIIFGETGLVVLPFLPGDSLLFVAGALAAAGALDITYVIPLLMLAAFLGDNCNYWIGREVGGRMIRHGSSHLIKRDHLDRTHAFYKKHGGKTILFARFLPIIRTFAPFVAGIARMDYRVFLLFSALGGLFWINIFTLGGYFLGNIPFIKQNLTILVLGIIVITLVPAMLEFIRHRLKKL